MELCLMIEGREGVTWPQWLELAGACEEHGIAALFAELRDAGVSRVMCQHLLHEDLDAVPLLGELAPRMA